MPNLAQAIDWHQHAGVVHVNGCDAFDQCLALQSTWIDLR